MLCQSWNVPQHPSRVLNCMLREVWKQKPSESGGRILSIFTELCSRPLNWETGSGFQLCLAFLPHTLRKLWNQRSNAVRLSQVVKAVITVKPSPSKSCHVIRFWLCWSISAHMVLITKWHYAIANLSQGCRLFRDSGLWHKGHAGQVCSFYSNWNLNSSLEGLYHRNYNDGQL